MQVRLLGPLDVVVHGAPLPLSGLRRKAILAVLALHAGEVVSTDRLTALVWGDRPAGVNTVQSHVSHLRRVLGSRSAITARSPGYVTGLDTDLAAAEQLIRAGRQAADPVVAAGLLRSALGLWRGRPLADLVQVPWLAGQSDRLAALELDAGRALVEVRLALGEHRQLLPQLRDLAAAHPFDEQVQGQLAVALYRSGRQADALALLRQVRARLAAELGIDPGPALRELEAAVLRQEPSLAPPEPTIDVRGGPALAAAELPQFPGTALQAPGTAPQAPGTAPQASPTAPLPEASEQGVSAAATRPVGGGHVPPLVGRSRELAVLEGLVTGSPAAPFLVVGGDPGIGKTRLLTELAGLAQGAGRSVLWGRATEFEQQAPFAVVTDALCDVGAGSLHGLSDEDLNLLGALLPMLPGSGAPAGLPGLGAERYRLHRAVCNLLDVLALDTGLVLVLDDVHWADQGSAELIDHLLRHPPRGPVLVAVAYRPRQLSGRLRQGLGRAIKDGVVESLDLGPLSTEAVDALLPARLDGERRREVHAAGKGNPFYVLALARADLTALDSASPDDDDALPTQVRAALAAELDALTPVQEQVVWAAAVAGDAADPELVACIAGLTIEDTLQALDALVARDLLRPVPHTGRFGFRHPLVRRVAHDAAGPGWRITAHARAATALRERGAPAAEQAHHIERSAHRGDHDAITVLREAATTAMHSSPASAARWLATALRLLPSRPGTTDLRLELLGLRAQTLGLTGRLQESRETVHELLQLLPVEADEMRTSLVSMCAWIERLLGRHAEARALLLAELANQPDPGSPSAATLMLGLSVGQPLEADRDRQEWPRKTVEAARRTGERPLLAGALAAWVIADQTTGKAGAETYERLDEAAALVDAMPDGELARLLHAAVWLSLGEICEERTADALRHLRRGLGIARTAGQAYVIGQIHTLFVYAYGQTGNLAAATRHIEDARDMAELSGSSQFLANVSAYQCYIATLRGDLDLALRLGRQTRQAAGGRRDFYAAMVYGPLAFAHLHAGDPAACTALLTSALDRPESSHVAPMSRVWWYALLAEAAAAQGRPDGAARWADLAEAEIHPWSPPRRRGTVHVARAHALTATDPAGALDHARAAAKLFASVGEVVREGQAHLLAGTALNALGATTEARAAFTRARVLLDACGAHLFVPKALREESALDRPVAGPDESSAGADESLPGTEATEQGHRRVPR